MIKHILIPTDGSKLSERAAKAGVALAKSLGARVTAFVAAPPPTPIVYKDFVPVKYMAPEEHAEVIEQAALKYLGVIERAAKAAGVRCQSCARDQRLPGRGHPGHCQETPLRPDCHGFARAKGTESGPARQPDPTGARAGRDSGNGVPLTRLQWLEGSDV